MLPNGMPLLSVLAVIIQVLTSVGTRVLSVPVLISPVVTGGVQEVLAGPQLVHSEERAQGVAFRCF